MAEKVTMDLSELSLYEERKESVFGPGFRPWVQSKRRLRAAQERGKQHSNEIVIPKTRYMLRHHWVEEMYKDIDPDLSSSPRYVNRDLYIMNTLKHGDFHPLLALLKGTDSNFPGTLDPNYRFPPKDRTLLHFACFFGDKDKARILITHGADVNAVDLDDNTALHFAVNIPEQYHSLKIIKTLLQSGADINHQNSKGWTALHRACVLGDIKLVNVLLGFNPDVYMLTDKSHVPYQLVTRNLDEIWELFQDNAVKENKTRHIRMWAHILSQDFVEQLFQAVEPSCSTCKKKVRDCGKLKKSNFRLWIYKHKILGIKQKK